MTTIVNGSHNYILISSFDILIVYSLVGYQSIDYIWYVTNIHCLVYDDILQSSVRMQVLFSDNYFQPIWIELRSFEAIRVTERPSSAVAVKITICFFICRTISFQMFRWLEQEMQKYLFPNLKLRQENHMTWTSKLNFKTLEEKNRSLMQENRLEIPYGSAVLEPLSSYDKILLFLKTVLNQRSHHHHCSLHISADLLFKHQLPIIWMNINHIAIFFM